VLEVISAFEQASSQPVPYRFVPSRAGDISQCYADVSLGARLPDWHAKYILTYMCQDFWRWQQYSPDGY